MTEDAEKPSGRKFNIGDIVLDRDGDEESSTYVTTLPFLLLISYIARIATVAKRTLTIGPLILRESQR